MIRSFASRQMQRFYEEGDCPPKWRSFEAIAVRKLFFIETAVKLDDLKEPPGNRLEALKGERKGQFSIRINGQWRICFRWKAGVAENVEIVDYH